MIVWIAIVGACIGWALADFEGYGVYLGGMAGAAAGWALSRAIRAEVTRATQALQEQIDSLRDIAPPTTPPVVNEPTAPPVSQARAMPQPMPASVSVPHAAPVPEDRPAPIVHAEPGMIETMASDAIAAAKAWLFGGNTIVRVGLIILFVGLSFLASYAASAGLFPIELRLSLVAAVGAALLAVGFRSRTDRPGFGLSLQGGGVATIYLTLFAAAKLYDTVPVTAAFGLMIAVCILGCALALLQLSQALAATAFAGGFAVPLLLAGGGGSILIVFAYYTLLNLAILFIAQRQSWRALNLIGFFATFGFTSLWYIADYRPADFTGTQIFVIASVLIYVATAILYARATPGRLGNVVDTTLLFGPALAGFGLEVGLVHDRPFGTAFAALGFAALYLAVAGWTMRYRRDSYRVVNETMLAIGIGFVTLAIPLALGARWTSAAWALEGAGAFWVGMRQARWMPRFFGLLLMLIAASIYLVGLGENVAAIPIANAGFLGAMLIALSVLTTAWWLRESLPHSGSRMARSYAGVEAALGIPAFLFGFLFWCVAWAQEATRMTPPIQTGTSRAPAYAVAVQPLLVMLACIASAWGAQWVGRRWRWPVACWPSYATLIVLALTLIATTGAGRHVLYVPDIALWIVAIGLHVHMLYLNDRDPIATDGRTLPAAIHVGSVWLGAALLADCLWMGIDRAQLWNSAWAEVTALVATLAVLTILTLTGGRAMLTGPAAHRWPLDRHAIAYGWYAALPIAGLTYAGALLTALLSSGSAAPLPYIPLVNPVDLTLGLAMAALEYWRRAMLAASPPPFGADRLSDTWALAMLAGLAFVVVNTIWLRVAHQMLDVPGDGDALLSSVVVQTGLAILWTSLALALMILAYRRGRRALWLVGAGLLALTVVKLLIVDLNAAGGAARIVAFIAVGILMLVVGYFAPIPPKATAVPEAVPA